MRLPVAVLFLLLLALVPPPAAAEAAWSVDARVTIKTASSADYTWTVTGLTNTRLTLPMPDNATFVEARDVDGRKLEASSDGAELEVTSGSKPFVVTFTLEGQRDGPFTIFPAQVASASDSPVSVGIVLAPGWSLAGYRDNDEATEPDASGTFRHTGPAYVQFLALSPAFVDPGPDATVAGHVVRRHGVADIAADGAAWSLVTTYDSDVFSRQWEVHVPPGATVTSATTPVGPLETTREGDLLRIRTPYPVGYGLGGRSFTVNMTLPPPDVHAATFLQANLSVRAAEGDRVRIDARVAPGLQFAGTRAAGGRETAPLRFEGDGPLSVSLAFLPPAASGHVQFTEGMFVVDTPFQLLEAARATAKSASALLPSAAPFLMDPFDTRPFYVTYTDAPIFSWEEGFYSNGLNTIAIRAKTLETAADGEAHLVPVGVLAHEAAHGLADRRFPDAPHNMSFLHEGLSRLVETNLEGAFQSEIVSCRTTSKGQECDRHSARPGADDLKGFHKNQTAFDISWGAADAGEDERGFLYDYSGFVLHAFHERAPPGALANFLAHVNRTTFTGNDGQDSASLLSLLQINAPGTPIGAILYPGREDADLSEEEFRFCMGALVAPGYPWEGSSAPAAGCAPTGYGPKSGTLPPPPAAPTPAPPAPVVVVTPRPTISPPVASTQTTVTSPTGSSTSGGDGETPGAVVTEDPARPGSGAPAIPFPSIALVLAAVAGAALGFSLRRRA